MPTESEEESITSMEPTPRSVNRDSLGAAHPIVIPALRSMMSKTTTDLTEQDVETIGAQMDKHFKAVLDHDPDAFLSTCTDDIIFLPPDQAVVEGRDACRAFVEEFPQPEIFDGNIIDLEGQGDLAFARGEVDAKFPDGATASFKFIAIHRRQPDGSWKMARDMWNMNAPAPA